MDLTRVEATGYGSKQSFWKFSVFTILIFGVIPTQQVKFNLKGLGSQVVSSACSLLGWECCYPPFLVPPDEAIKSMI